MWRRRIQLALCLAATGCNAPEPPASTGGTVEPAGPCGRGLGVVHSDFSASSNVSLVAYDGRVLSPSFLSSAISGASLSAPLSGDVVLPTSRLTGEELVLIDRYPASVLSWVDVRSARVRAQLDVGERKNPHDYVPLADGRAYVTRFQADDVLIVDPSVPASIGSIDLSAALGGQGPEFSASPGRAVLARDRVFVVLEGYAAGFVNGSAPSRIVAIDPATDSIAELLVLDGAHSCSAIAVAPDERELAVSCAGVWSGAEEPDPATSFVVRIGTEPLVELGRHAALELGEASFGFGLDYASQSRIVVTRFGVEDARPDTLVELDTDSGQARELLSSAAFTLGDVRCAPQCAACFATDADRRVIHRFEVTDAGLGPSQAFVADTRVGLPPRWLGRF